jgi:hypothetical protein
MQGTIKFLWLAQSASGYRENQEVFAIDVYAFGSDLAEDDWRKNC